MTNLVVTEHDSMSKGTFFIPDSGNSFVITGNGHIVGIGDMPAVTSARGFSTVPTLSPQSQRMSAGAKNAERQSRIQEPPKKQRS